MSKDRLLSVEEAQDRVFAAIAGPTEPELAWLSEALGRVAAEPVASPLALPPWDNSAMDGYAIRAADVGAASEDQPATLEVIGEVRAGQPPDTEVRRGTAVRIATGAPVPPGADAVIPVELTTPLDASGAVAGERGRDATGPLPAQGSPRTLPCEAAVRSGGMGATSLPAPGSSTRAPSSHRRSSASPPGSVSSTCTSIAART